MFCGFRRTREWRFAFLLMIVVWVLLLTGCGGGGGGSSGGVPAVAADPVDIPREVSAGDPFPDPESAGGEPVIGYPTWEERALLVLTNMVRMDPREYRDRYTTYTGILLAQNYPVVGPLYWHLNLSESARFHAEDMATNDCVQHDSCDGTVWWQRILSFFPDAESLWENLAAGTISPRETLNLLLCEQRPPCVPDFGGDDGHRQNIMDSEPRILGTGYSPNVSGSYSDYWVQDFASNAPASEPPLVAGTHLMVESVLTFFLSYYSQDGLPPQEVRVVVDGVPLAMNLDLGVEEAGTYSRLAVTSPDCRSYYFEALDADGTAWRYPGSGELQTFGVRNCLDDYLP